MSQVVIRAVNHMNPTKTGGSSCICTRWITCVRSFILIRRDVPAATLYLAIHIIVSGVQYRDIRTFSVTEGWDSGGRIVYFGELDTYARTAIEKTWATLDGANSQSYDPVNSAFSLLRIRRLPGAGGWDNVRFQAVLPPRPDMPFIQFILVFQCGRSKPVYRPIHEMTPLLLCYLTNPPGADRISLQHTITASHQAKIGDLPINYDWLDGPWRKVNPFMTSVDIHF